MVVTADVGVPLITPVDGFSVSPGGIVVDDQVYAGVPPLAASVAEYGAFMLPPGSDDVLIANGGAIVREKLRFAVSGTGAVESVSVITTEVVLEAVAVPLMTPVD